MPDAAQMPLQEVLQALSRTPVSQPQLRAALATTCARWQLLRGDEGEAIRHLGHALEMVPDLRPAMRLLYRIYLDRGDVRSAVMYLDQEIRATRHPREAAALYRERGQLVESHFHDLSAAQQCYQAALKATPRDLAVLRSVERVSLARGDVFWLVANLESQLEVMKDEAAIAGVLHDLALLEARHRGDLALAGDILVGALELFPRHLVLASDLFRLAEVAGDAELMLMALEVEAEGRPPERRAMPLARASVTLREHRERGAALELLRAAAEAAPHNFSLWRSLEELAMATTRYDVAMLACTGQLRAVGESEEATTRAELLYRMGKLALFRIERPSEGLAAMRKALRLTPGHPLVMEDAGRFLNAGEMWAKLLELVDLEIGSSLEAGMTSQEVALAHLRAGQIMEERLGEFEGARGHYHEAIAADPAYRPARDRLERILHQLGDHEGLRRYYADELPLASTNARRVFLLSVLGQLHSVDEDPSEAIKHLGALLEVQPDHPSSLQVLARLLAKADRSDELLRVTQQEIALTQSAHRKAKLIGRGGELALSLGQRGLARQMFVSALEIVDDHLPSIESLGRLLREEQDWDALIELLRKQLLYANDRPRQVSIQLEIATLLATRKGRNADALVELQALLERWPRHLPALHAAERLAQAVGEPEILLELLEQHVASVTGPRTRALLLHRVANIRVSLADHEGAIRDLVRSLELWPQLGVARARLLQLYEMLGRHRELQAFAQSGLTSERGADDRRAMAVQLAELSPKPVVAIQYLGAVAEARPEDFVTQLRLARACHQAGRTSREAGALLAAASQFALQVPKADPGVLGLRYLAARAAEAAGNLEVADRGYTAVLDADAEHSLATRGRQRIRERKRETALRRKVEDLEAAAAKTTIAAERAAYLTIVAELHERRSDLRTALASIESAIGSCPAYLPALHARARMLERRAEPGDLAAAVATLEQLARQLRDPRHRSAVLCHAGTLSLRDGQRGEPNPAAWRLFGESLSVDPDSARAVRGLLRTLEAHTHEGAPALSTMLQSRLMALRRAGDLDAAALRELVRLGADVDGPESVVLLLEEGMALAPGDPVLRIELAQAHARLGNWTDVVSALDAALAREMSPERAAALQYFAGEANDRAGSKAQAVDHFLAAARAGFHPRHALRAAESLAAEIGATDRRADALQRLVDVSDGPERVHNLRTLADIHRRHMGQPERAVSLMRELLLLRPTDLDVLAELRRLLNELGREDEATAAMLAAIAHHRAWLRSPEAESHDRLGHESVAGLMRLFDMIGESDGYYVAACVLELIAPTELDPHRRPDGLTSEPWPLPAAREGRPFAGLAADLPCSPALDLLREGVFYIGAIPIGTPQRSDLVASRSLPSNNAAVMVVRALANAMGAPQPLVFLDASSDASAGAHIGATPCLLLGRRLVAAPADAWSRDAIGRALLRLATGGDGLHRATTPSQLFGLLVGLCNASGVEVEAPGDFDWKIAAQVVEQLPSRDTLHELAETATAFARSIDRFDPELLADTLAMAEDRAGAVCAADPRPALERVVGTAAGLLRPRTLIGYLLSDDHLALRRSLGYHLEIARPPPPPRTPQRREAQP